MECGDEACVQVRGAINWAASVFGAWRQRIRTLSYEHAGQHSPRSNRSGASLAYTNREEADSDGPESGFVGFSYIGFHSSGRISLPNARNFSSARLA